MINTVFGKETHVIKFSVIAPNATYDLVRNTAGVNEGSSFNITLNTTGVQNGQSIPYTITGIQQADINEPLTGSFVVQNGQANKTFNVVADVLTEGMEVFTMTLDGVGSNVSVTINDTSTAGDPYWANVVLLMHVDTVDNFVNMAATHASNFSSFRTGTVSISTLQSKFGSASAKFNGDGAIVLDADIASFTLSGDFTVEMWARPTAFGQLMVLYGNTNYTFRSPAGEMIITNTGRPGWRVDSITRILSPASLTLNVWHHLCVVRSSWTTRLFVNGTLQGVSLNDYNVYASDTNRPVIGASGQDWMTSPYVGYLDEIRITNGVARYTTDFTPPTAPFLSA